MGRVIRPRPAAWEAREQEISAQNALWEEQDRLAVELALTSGDDAQQAILERLDDTYREVAEHNWGTDWEQRAYAVPDKPFARPEIPEHLQFTPSDLRGLDRLGAHAIVRDGVLVDTQADLLVDDEEQELELELH